MIKIFELRIGCLKKSFPEIEEQKVIESEILEMKEEGYDWNERDEKLEIQLKISE